MHVEFHRWQYRSHFALQAEHTFGKKGDAITSGFLASVVIGWYAFQTGPTGTTVHASRRSMDWSACNTGERSVFVFIGAYPNTTWLRTCGISLDNKGFVQTGVDLPDANMLSISLQTSVEGVFAIGDVRSGLTNHVASAVGEGAGVVAQIQGFLTRAY